MIAWPDYVQWRDEFAKVLDPRRYTLEWLDWQVLSGAYRLLVSDHAAILFEFKTYPTGAMDVHGILAAGDLEKIRGVLIPEAERIARSIGCIGSIIESRAGWQKALKHNGYELHQTVLRKEL